MCDFVDNSFIFFRVRHHITPKLKFVSCQNKNKTTNKKSSLLGERLCLLNNACIFLTKFGYPNLSFIVICLLSWETLQCCTLRIICLSTGFLTLIVQQTISARSKICQIILQVPWRLAFKWLILKDGIYIFFLFFFGER